jgi:hypothetical protein
MVTSHGLKVAFSNMKGGAETQQLNLGRFA